jgi:hypothetical protein
MTRTIQMSEHELRRGDETFVEHGVVGSNTTHRDNSVFVFESSRVP